MDDSTISFIDKDSIEDEMHNIEKYPLEKQDLYFNTEKSNNFFLEETAGFGNAYLCGYSHFHLKNISNKLDEDEVELDMKIAYLSLQLSVDQRKLFSEIIDGIIEKERKKFVAKDESFNKKNEEKNNMTMIPYEIQLPRNENEIRKYYIESKFSICDNLPIPHIQNLSNHSYISPIDIISNILGHGLPLDTIMNIY